MSTEGVLIWAFLAVVVAGWTLYPWLRRQSISLQAAEEEKQYERLRVLYERVLSNLRDLDEDHDTGKINDADYAEERELWVQRGIQVLHALDEHEGIQNGKAKKPTRPVKADKADKADKTDDAIEAAIAAYRKKLKA